MAMGIGQQIRDMVGRARHYWAELTDDKDSHQRAQHERKEEAIHQGYGGVRSQDEPVDTDLHGRPADLADRVPPHAPPLSHSARTGQSARRGEAKGAGDSPTRMQGAGQAQRQYTQQGGSGIQKTLGEQLGGSSTDAPRQTSRRSRPQSR